MNLFNWDDSFSVGVVMIDDQHKKLVEMINELHAAMLEGKAKVVLGEIINRMAEYSQFHFQTEEKYFEEFNFELTVVHEAQHKAFIEKVGKFKRDFDENNVALTIEVMNFLKDWLINHIQGADKLYTKCFNDHGLK